MTRLISTSLTHRAVDPNNPTEGMTIDALMARQRQLQQQRPEAPAQIASPWQGVSLMANTFANQVQQNRIDDQEKAGRASLAAAMARQNPMTGELPSDAMATVATLDPERAYEMSKSLVDYRREQANRDQWVDIPAPPGGKPGEQWQQNKLTGEKQVRGGAGGGININTDAKMPEWAAKTAMFYKQASDSGMDLEDFESALTSTPESMTNWISGGSNFLNSPEYQMARTAGDSWIQAVLRPESGAVIGPEEMVQYRKTYLPQPGDDAKTIVMKRRMRDDKTNNLALGIRSVAPDTYKMVQDEIDVKRAKRKAPQDPNKKPVPDPSQPQPQDPADPNAPQKPPVLQTPTADTMTPEQIDAVYKAAKDAVAGGVIPAERIRKKLVDAGLDPSKVGL